MVKALNMYEVEAIRNYYQSLTHKDDSNDNGDTSIIPNEK